MSFHPELTGKVAVVTGASRGIGRAIAVELARYGATIVAAGRDETALDETSEAIRAVSGKPASSFVADLSDKDAPERMIEEAARLHGRLDILVNNAGATKRGDFLELSDADVQEGFALKYHASVRACRAAWPHLKASGGSIVNISGIGAHTPDAEFTIGGPVNSALINFTKAIADRGLADDIQVNLICPGHIVTDRLSTRIRALAEKLGCGFDEAREKLRISYGITRFGSPEDIANTVVFVCSPMAAYIHGATINIDGGATRGL
jgi:3-oxoacyl-[acyl-carrier protein] reductase